MLLLDTQTLVWWVTENRKLGRKVGSRLRTAQPGQVAVSVLSWYELSTIKSPQGAQLWQHVSSIRRRLTGNGLAEVELTAPMSLDAAGLSALTADPFDRLILAAAREMRATLVTADESILAWAGKVDRLDART